MKTKGVGKGLYARTGEWAERMRKENNMVAVSLKETQEEVEKDREDGNRGFLRLAGQQSSLVSEFQGSVERSCLQKGTRREIEVDMYAHIYASNIKHIYLQNKLTNP